MKMSIRLKAVLVIVAIGSFTLARGQQKLTGSYSTSIGGQPVSQESFTLTVDANGAIESEADVRAGPNTNHVMTRSTKTAPQTFSLTVADKGGITTTFNDGAAKVSITGQPEREVKTQATVVLENGVWHQYIFLLRQYDAVRGGSQSFKAFLPSQATEFQLQLERVDSPVFEVKGARIATDHFRATTNQGLVLDLWADSNRVPLIVSIPLQGVKVIRGGSEDLADVVFGKPSATAIGNFTSEEVTFANGDVKLAGTLTLPKAGKAPFPAAAIVTGSGAQDRDGAMGVFNLYKLVAESLSNAGIAVLRADDRGVGKSVMADSKRPTSYRDLINDTKAAFEFLAQRNDIDKARIALVGHSEGAETALTIAAEDNRVAAIALLGGTASPVDRVAVEQSIYQLALQETIDPADLSKLPALARTIIARFDAARNEKPPASGPDPNAWFREHIASDPSALAKRVKCPVLILNGERDALVLAHNALELAQALRSDGNKQVRLRIFPNLTHTFTPASINKNAPPEETTTVSPEMLQTLSNWASGVLLGKTR